MTKNIQGNFSPLVFDNRLGLKAVSGSYEGEPAEALGYSAVGDGGDVEFTWTQGSPPATHVDDGNATTLPDGGDGSSAWIAKDVPLQYSVKWGLVGDGIADDTIQNQRMVDFAAANDQATVLYEPGGDFAVSTLTNSTGLTLLGENCVFTGITDPIITHGQFIIYNNTKDYPIGEDVKGSDNIHYTAFIANGPASSVVGPVGDLTGTWKILNSSLWAQNNFYHVQDRKASGTNGGVFNNLLYRTRDLNTEGVNTIAGASLSVNQITLPAGTYHFSVSAPGRIVDSHKIRLYNITDAALALLGTSAHADQSGVQSDSNIDDYITITSTKVFEIQHWGNATSANSTGFGAATISGDDEIYTDVRIWKVA